MRFAPLALAIAYAPCAACATPALEHVPVPADGISIAIYRQGSTGYGVVDDRRWVDVVGGTMFLDRIDAHAALPTLVIEPLAGDALKIGTCVRERIDPSPEGLALLAQWRPLARRVFIVGDPTASVAPGTPSAVAPPLGVLSPVVRCSVTAIPGRHRVRVLYVTPALVYRTRHEVAVTNDRATVITQFAITTPMWRAEAQLTLFDGVPSREHSPREVARGKVTLDGGTSVIALPTREVAARLRRVYDGAVVHEESKPSDGAWGGESRTDVRVWLELDGVALAPGPANIHVDVANQPIRDLEVVVSGRELPASQTLPLLLWIDDQLIGARSRTVHAGLGRGDGRTLDDTIRLAVSNVGGEPREVWVEERLRPAKRREVTQASTTSYAIANGVIRARLVVAPGATERLRFTIHYEP